MAVNGTVSGIYRHIAELEAFLRTKQLILAKCCWNVSCISCQFESFEVILTSLPRCSGSDQNLVLRIVMVCARLGAFQKKTYLNWKSYPDFFERSWYVEHEKIRFCSGGEMYTDHPPEPGLYHELKT